MSFGLRLRATVNFFSRHERGLLDSRGGIHTLELASESESNEWLLGTVGRERFTYTSACLDDIGRVEEGYFAPGFWYLIL